MVEELTESSTYETPQGESRKVERISHCLRGNVLWCVVEVTGNGIDPQRFISCDLIERGAGGLWGHKPMDEAMHPYYYTCPLKYLEMAPAECEEWRNGVRDYHAHATAKASR